MSMLVRKGTMLHRGSTRRHNNNNNNKNNKNSRRDCTKKPTAPPRIAAVNISAVAGDSERAVTVVTTADATSRCLAATLTAAVKPAKLVEKSPRENPNNNVPSQVNSFHKENECKIVLYDYNMGDTSTMASYGSFSYQLRTASEESNGVCEFIFRALEIIANTVAVTIFITFCLFFTFVMVIFGLQYLENCPKEPNIPVYLLVGGCFGLLKMASLLWRQSKSRHFDHLDYTFNDTDLEEVAPSTSSKVTHHTLSLFLLAWFILGNYWIFRVYKPRFQPLLLEPSNWCDQNIYTFALVHCYICYVIIAVFLVLIITLFLGHKLGCL